MRYNQSRSNNKIKYNITEYKTCTGRNCNNKAKHYLMISLIKKSAWFCDECKMDLESNGLVEL